MSDFVIRRAETGDAATVLALLGELAAYEKQPFETTQAVIRRDMLGPQTLCPCALAFDGAAPAGIASWFWTYKSFGGARVLYLEDLFVRPDFRGRGLGKAMLAWLAAQATDGFMEWRVLDWNAPSIAFYDSLGAAPLPDWITYRLQGDALRKLAGA